MSPCDFKNKHATRGDALIEIKRSGARGLHPYRCRDCRAWHVGHAKKVGR